MNIKDFMAGKKITKEDIELVRETKDQKPIAEDPAKALADAVEALHAQTAAGQEDDSAPIQ